MKNILVRSAIVSIISGLFGGLFSTSNPALAAIFLFWAMLAAVISFAAVFFILMDTLCNGD